MQTLVTNETVRTNGKPMFTGTLTMRVWWANGYVSETVCRNYGEAYDVIGGEAPPYLRWEIVGQPFVRLSLAEFSRKYRGKR
jgi:hypothetical protein